MARINRHVDSKNIEDHIVAEGHGVEIGAEKAPVKDINWDVKSAEVHADPLVDGGTGPTLLVRRFKFQLPPGLAEQPGHDELLDWHKKHTVIPTLWKDELELADEPRIIADKKGAFTIVAICAPRNVLGVKSFIHERPELLQNMMNGQNRRDTK